MRKELIRILLREVMRSAIDNWEINSQNFGNVFSTLISYDDETEDKLYLFVGFSGTKQMEYSYSFMVLDKNDKPLTEYITNREELRQYIPENLKGTRQILPIIYELTRKLLKHYSPDKILRQMVEKLSGHSEYRYDIITDIMMSEFGYNVKESGYDREGKKYWIMEKIINETKNKEPIFLDIESSEERKKMWEDQITRLIPKLKIIKK
jgi:hypothetical protein